MKGKSLNMQRNSFPTTRGTTWQSTSGTREGPQKVSWQWQYRGKGLFLQLQFEHFKGPLTLMFQLCWNSGCMPQAWKVCSEGCIFRIISSMETYLFDGGLYKIFTKVLANRLQKYLPKLIHPAQYGFIVGRNVCIMCWMFKWPWIMHKTLIKNR